MRALRFILTVVLAGVRAIVVAQGVEIFINRMLRPDAQEVTWIGDLVAGSGVMVMTTLWLQLWQARQVSSALERERLVLDTQLSIASQVFDPVWEPHYLAYPGGLTLPRVLADVAALVAGGYRRIFLN